MTKLELYEELNYLADNGQILDSSNPAYLLCRTLFERLGIVDKFDPTDPEKTAVALYAFEGLDNANKKAVDKTVKEISEEMTAAAEDAEELGTKSLNSQDLKVLLEEYDAHRALEEEERIKILQKSPKLKNIGRDQIKVLVETKIRLEAEAIQRGVSPRDADIQSDQIIITEDLVQSIGKSDNLSETQRWTTAEEVVRLAYEAKNTEEALTKAAKNRGFDIVVENREELTRMVEEVRATIRTEERVTSIAQSFANELETNGVILTDDKRNKIVSAAKTSIERIVLDDPLKSINDPVEEVVVSLDGGLEHVTLDEPLMSKISVIIGKTEAENAKTTVGIAMTGAEKAATDLFKPGAASTDVGGAKSKQISDSLLKMGFNRADMEALRAMRYAATASGPEAVVSQEKAIVNEIQAANEAHSRGFTEDKSTQASREATVVTALLKSDQPVRRNIEIIILHKEELRGSKEMKPAVDVAEKMNKEPRLINSVEMIRKLVHWQDRIDKLTGGLITKITGKSAEQMGKMLGLESLQQYGVQLATRFGGEMVGAMATHLAEFGFEQGLKNVLGQLFTTGTVTAVKAGASAAGTAAAGTVTAAGAVAVDGAAAAAAGTGVGIPIALILLAAQLLWVVGSALWKQGEKLLVGALESLGILSAKNIADAKKMAGDAFKYGIVVLGAITTLILNIPRFIAMLPMAIVGTVLAITISALIGHNLLQTGSTQISSMVSPKGSDGGGTCVKKSDTTDPAKPGGKLANCDTSKTGSVPGVSKDAFVDLASRWSAGGGTNAARCYGAVVCAALAAGKNPTFALWAWLHESGASNYSLGQIEDFGIHGQGPATNDFNAQIGVFMNLNPGYCNSQNGMDYWLGFATNYLTGTCDPNVMVGSNNGYTYLAEMQSTWSWVSSSPMPATANGSGGATCGGGSGSGEEETQTDPETGEEYLCYGGGTVEPGGPGFPRGTGAPTKGPSSPYPTRNPSIPIPPGCPMGWPVDGNMPVTQGSEGPTHGNIPGAAVDIMPTDASGNGTIGGSSIQVTHPGVVVYSGYSGGAYGNLVIVRGSCGGKNFVTYYGHLMDSQLVGMNQTLTMGQSVGLADNSGDYPAGNDHLHYEIRGCDSTSGGCYGTSGFDPKAYLPKPVPDNCFWNCNVNTGP